MWGSPEMFHRLLRRCCRNRRGVHREGPQIPPHVLFLARRLQYFMPSRKSPKLRELQFLRSLSLARAGFLGSFLIFGSYVDFQRSWQNLCDGSSEGRGARPARLVPAPGKVQDLDRGSKTSDCL